MGRFLLLGAVLHLHACGKIIGGSASNSVPIVDDLAGIFAASTLGQHDTSCATNPNHQSCVFYKNPYTTASLASAPLASTANTDTNVNEHLSFGINLVGLDSSSYLQNASISIKPGVGSRARANANGDWKHNYNSACSGAVGTDTCTQDSSHKLGQVMTYYWMTQQRLFMRDQGGTFYALGRDITVDTFKPGLFNAYYQGGAQKIVLGGYNNSYEFATSAEITAHEYAHANFDWAHGGGIYYHSSTHLDGGYLCRTASGCLGAINEGQADYSAAILFADSPQAALGENIVGNNTGLSDRNLDSPYLNGVAADVHTNTLDYSTDPSESGLQGSEIHSMGNVYAAIWWKIRKDPGTNTQEVDTLFSEHLMSLGSSDTFVTAKDTILTLDTALMGGKYRTVIINAFADAGL